MSFTYNPLWKTMKEKGVTQYQMMTRLGVHTRLLYRLRHNEGINIHTLVFLCKLLNCTPNDIIEIVPDEAGK